jgi:hypothetical protein
VKWLTRSVIARDQIHAVVIKLQSATIKQLQMGIQFENAVINFTLLHEESITCRIDTLSALDQMRQRVMPHSISSRTKDVSGVIDTNTILTQNRTRPDSVDAAVDANSTIVSTETKKNVGTQSNELTNYVVQRRTEIPRWREDSHFSIAPSIAALPAMSISGIFTPNFPEKPDSRFPTGSKRGFPVTRDVNQAYFQGFKRGSDQDRAIESIISDILNSYTNSDRDHEGLTLENRPWSSSREAMKLRAQDAPESPLDRRDTVSIAGKSTMSPYVTQQAPRLRDDHESIRLDGRPCKTNNYWGICKGAWVIREDALKGLVLRTKPTGMYNVREILECMSCTFHGPTYSVPHSLKKNRRISVVDPKVYTAMCGIRYRWIFLAKSHVKKKAHDAQNETHYGCILCLSEVYVIETYDGIEMLMNHIAQVHIQDMSHELAKKMRCIQGRIAGNEEDWDINVPLELTQLAHKSKNVRRDDKS